MRNAEWGKEDEAPGGDAPAAASPHSPVEKGFRFQKHEHLRRTVEFQRVYDRRRSVSDRWLIVYGCENDRAHLRLGLSVSRKVGGAPVRNRLRRLYREAFRLHRHEMPVGIDLVLIPRGGEVPSLADLEQSLPKLVRLVAQKLGVAPPAGEGAGP